MAVAIFQWLILIFNIKDASRISVRRFFYVGFCSASTSTRSANLIPLLNCGRMGAVRPFSSCGNETYDRHKLPAAASGTGKIKSCLNRQGIFDDFAAGERRLGRRPQSSRLPTGCRLSLWEWLLTFGILEYGCRHIPVAYLNIQHKRRLTDFREAFLLCWLLFCLYQYSVSQLNSLAKLWENGRCAPILELRQRDVRPAQTACRSKRHW